VQVSSEYACQDGDEQRPPRKKRHNKKRRKDEVREENSL
jgi:hypothetical protein